MIHTGGCGMSRNVWYILCIIGLVACGENIMPVPTAMDPIFDPLPNTFDHIVDVTITAEPGMTIRFTADGTEPTREKGYFYQAPIKVFDMTTIKAIAYGDRAVESGVTNGTFTLSIPPAQPPIFDPSPGVYVATAIIGMRTITPGANIRYTLDGSDPQTSGSSRIYYGPMEVNTSTTVKAYAFKKGLLDSQTSTGEYLIKPLGLCDLGWNLWCQLGPGHVTTYEDPYIDKFNNDFVMSSPTYAWCASARMWLQDLAGVQNDHVWACHDDVDLPTASWYEVDQQGQLVKTLEAEFIFCSCDRGANHGQSLVNECKTKYRTADTPTCRDLLAKTAYEPEGGIGYWHIHYLLTGEVKNYYAKRHNPTAAPVPKD